jgi:hypothetical protein
MSFTTHGINWEGLLRALQTEITVSIGIIAFAFIAMVLVRRYLFEAQDERGLGPDLTRAGLRIATRSFLVVTLVTLGALAWKFASVASVNRMPRADADKSGVYEQMRQTLGTKPTPDSKQ